MNDENDDEDITCQPKLP